MKNKNAAAVYALSDANARINVRADRPCVERAALTADRRRAADAAIAADIAAHMTAADIARAEREARAAKRQERIDRAWSKVERLNAAAVRAEKVMHECEADGEYLTAEAAAEERDDLLKKAKNAFAAWKRVQTICAKEAAAEEAAARADAEAMTAAPADAKPARADMEARADARAAADALTAEAARAARMANAADLTAEAAEAARAADVAQNAAKGAKDAARLAATVTEYRAARDAEAAAADALTAARADDAAALKREAERRAETVADHNKRVEDERAAAAKEAIWIEEGTKRAARSAAKANQTRVESDDLTAREARAAAGEDALTADSLTWQVAFYPLDYRAALKGIRRREAGADMLMNDALTAVCIHAENVTAADRAAAIHAALTVMHGDEFDGAGDCEAAALAAAVDAAKGVKPADLTAAKDKKPAALTVYENALTVLQMTVTVLPSIVAADDAAQLYNAARSVVQSSTRRAYNAVKGAGVSTKGIEYAQEEREGKNVGTMTDVDHFGAALRYAKVSASREDILSEMYGVSRRPDILLCSESLVSDMMQDAALALLTAAHNGAKDAHAAALAAHAAVNAILDGEGMQGRKLPDLSLEALSAVGFDAHDMTREEAARARADRAAIAAMLDECKPRMTERQRKVMQLTVFEKDEEGNALTVTAIAARADIKSKGTVGDIQNKARAILAEYALDHAADFSPAILRAARALTAAAEKRRADTAARVAACKARKREAARAAK